MSKDGKSGIKLLLSIIDGVKLSSSPPYERLGPLTNLIIIDGRRSAWVALACFGNYWSSAPIFGSDRGRIPKEEVIGY